MLVLDNDTFTEKAVYDGPVDALVLGPRGEFARSTRTHGGGQIADKALYFYLYKRHPWVYACIELIVQTASQDRHTYPSKDRPHGEGSPYGRVRKKAEDDGDEADLGPVSASDDGVEFLEQFFAEVNEEQSFSDLLAEVYRDLLISGEAFVLKQRKGASVENGPLGQSADPMVQTEDEQRATHVRQNPHAELVSLHRIPSRFTIAVPGDNGYPAKFKQMADNGSFREYAKEDVVYFRIPNPEDPARGLSPLESLDLTLATDMSAAKYNESYFRNGAKAGMVFSGQGLSEPEIRRNKEWIQTEYVKPENAHKPMFLLGNIELIRDGNKAQEDMDFINLRQFSREDICAVYSVPMSKLLHSEGGLGQAGKMSDDVTFRADTVGPLQTRVYEVINRQLMKREFPGRPMLIPPRQEKVRLDLLEAARSLVQVGGTGNESRSILHLPEVEDEEMDKPLFFTPGLRTLDPDDPTPGVNQQQMKGASQSDAQRPDRRSTRTSAGKTHAKVRRGVGMKTVK